MKATARNTPPPDFKVVIPARYRSRRLPGKVLRDLAGRPLIRHACDNALASAADEVVVATDDARIAACVEGVGGDVCMTQGAHASGTDRVAEVAATRGWPDDTLIVNVQADEPFLGAADINRLAASIADADCATLAAEMTAPQGKDDANKVKVVADTAGFALYFSRSPIPAGEGAWLYHLGIYAYRGATLRRYAALPQSPLERRERLEQLRLLESGHRIRIIRTSHPHCIGIDTEEDLKQAATVLRRRPKAASSSPSPPSPFGRGLG